MTTIVRENVLVQQLAGRFARSPLQLNALGESDAELIRLAGLDGPLAVTTDGIVEEIESGLYGAPYLIGWMTVMVNASDLAAVGAEPIGLLLNATLPLDLDAGFLDELGRGVAEACAACGMHVLGGDTNRSDALRTAATALGRVRDGAALTRRGCRPGDRLFASGPLGLGGAYALQRFRGRARPEAEIAYRPVARLREGRQLRGVASAAIDTSDGALAAIDELMRLNEVGIRLERPVREILHPAADRAATFAALPAWVMLAGPHGEFELVFTVPVERVAAFRRSARAEGWNPLELGGVIEEPGLRMPLGGSEVEVDAARVRNLFDESEGDVERYLIELLRLDAGLRSRARPLSRFARPVRARP